MRLCWHSTLSEQALVHASGDVIRHYFDADGILIPWEGEGRMIAMSVEQLRAVLAKHYLDDETLPVSEIAWLLGYCEVSSLTHAFKRWTGTTPRQFRALEVGPA